MTEPTDRLCRKVSEVFAFDNMDPGWRDEVLPRLADVAEPTFGTEQDRKTWGVRAGMELEVRHGELDEALALRRLYRRSASTNDAGRHAFATRPELAEPADEDLLARRVRVAVEGGRILGFAVIVLTEVGAAELDALFVDPDVVGRGIGRALLDDATEAALGAGMHHLEVVAGLEAVPFYERCGFERRGDASTEFGPAALMSRRLDR